MPLLSESWRLCIQVNATPFQTFVTEGVGASVYVAFSSVHMPCDSDPNWRNLIPLDSIGGMPLFLSWRSKEVEELVMVHADILNLFLSLFNSFRNQGCRMLQMSCEEHDKIASKSQFITHTIGRKGYQVHTY